MGRVDCAQGCWGRNVCEGECFLGGRKRLRMMNFFGGRGGGGGNLGEIMFVREIIRTR